MAFNPVTLWWYDGGQPLPERSDQPRRQQQAAASDLTADIVEMLGEIPGSGCLLIGDKGKIFSPDDYGEQFFVKLNGEKKFVHYKKHPAVEQIPQSLPRNAFKGDNDRRHHQEWIAAIKAGKPQDLLLAVRHWRATRGNHAARLRLAARRQEDRMGRPEHGRHQLPRSRAVHQTRQPRRLDACLIYGNRTTRGAIF